MTINLIDFETGESFPCDFRVVAETSEAQIGQATPTTTNAFGPVAVVVYEDGTIMTSIDWQTPVADEDLEDLEEHRYATRWMRNGDGKDAIILNGLPRILG